jgi:hypothetical protein
MNKDEAISALMHSCKDDMYEIVFSAYKDQYGTRPREMYKLTLPELVSWYISHYRWDEVSQTWETIIPFDY